MTRILAIIAIMFAAPAAAFSPDNVVISCPSEKGGRDVYIYKKYIMFGTGISWPYNDDTSHSVKTKVGDYFGWSIAVFEKQAQLEKLADRKGVFTRPIRKLKKKTSVNFKSFTRSVNFQFLNDALELVSEATEKVDCKDITPR
jgi:hypothetical protein